MKKKMSIDRIGKRGSIALLIIGIFCLFFGIYLQIQANKLPDDAIEVTAVISAFDNHDQSAYQTTSTLVTFSIEGTEYRNVPLGQYEASWKIGDTLNICCNKNNPSQIWTRTMQYRGVFYIIFSASFLLVSIYKLLLFRKARGNNDNESDMDESGQEKFKISSFIIPLASGIPFTVTGILYLIFEHSIFGIVIIIFGAMAIITGIFSLLDYINLKRRK